MQKRMYISNIDTTFSYHIAQFFRQDHLQVLPPLRIVGTSPQPLKYPWIHALINFQTHPQIACRAALDSDIVVLDLRSPTHEAETIIRFLQQVAGKQSQTIRIIGISSLLTWEGVKAFELQADQGDKQTMMSNILDENQWKLHEWTDKDYPKRIPGISATKCYQLENMLLDLNKKERVKASVLGIGLVYGKENQMIQDDLLRSLAGEEVTVWSQGRNLLPLVHIQTLLECLKILIEKQKEYAVARDDSMLSQQRVKQLLLEVSGRKDRPVKKQPLYVTEEECLWTFQPMIKCSDIFKEVSASKDFQNYCRNEILADLCEYTEWSPCQSVLFTQKFEQSQLLLIKQSLKGKIKIITDQQINALNFDLIVKSLPADFESQNKKNLKRLSKAEMIQQQVQSQPPRYAQVFDSLLPSLKYLNFIVVCSVKLQQFLKDSYFLKETTEIVKQYDQNNPFSQIVLGSQEWFSFMQLEQEQMEPSEEVKPLIDTAAINPTYSKENTGKKDEKLILTTQYLLDNVLGAISEAKFSMKSKNKTGLRSLIEELKGIWRRGNYQSCFQRQAKLTTTIGRMVK